MNSQEIIDYVMNTPNNTNPAILKQMLDANGGDSGGCDVLNEDGIIKQEHLPEGYPYKVIEEGYLLTTEDALTARMYFSSYSFGSCPKAIEGEEYTVIVNGVEQTATAYRDEQGNLCLGDATEGSWVVMFTDDGENGGIINTPDCPESCTASIYGPYIAIMPLSEDLLPEIESDVFIIYGGVVSDGSFSINKTYTEMLKAHSEGRKLVLINGHPGMGKVLELCEFATGLVFQRIAYEEGNLVIEQVTVKHDGATLTTHTIAVTAT